MIAGCLAAPARMRRIRAGIRTAVLLAALAAPAAALAQGADVSAPLAQCGACHGQDGNSAIPSTPSLAGQPEFFLLNQLILMREGVRRIDVMTALVRPLTDDQIGALASHFARQTAKATGNALDPALRERGAALTAKLRCASCHRADFGGQDQMPRLAGQRLDYLISSMIALRDNKRSGADTLMTAAITGVPDADLIAIAHYVAAP